MPFPWLWMLPPAHATDRTVGPSGEYATIAEALAAADPEDTLLLEAVEFVEEVELTFSITLDGAAGTVVRGPDSPAHGQVIGVNGAVDVVLLDLEIDGNGNHRCVWVSGGAFASLSGIAAVGCTSSDGIGGAALRVEGEGTSVEVGFSYFTDPVAPNGAGGQIWVGDATLSIGQSEIAFGAADDGGAVYAEDATLTLTDVAFHDNDADQGSALFVTTADGVSSVDLLGVTFHDNAGAGSVVELSFVDDATLEEVSFHDNEASDALIARVAEGLRIQDADFEGEDESLWVADAVDVEVYAASFCGVTPPAMDFESSVVHVDNFSVHESVAPALPLVEVDGGTVELWYGQWLSAPADPVPALRVDGPSVVDVSSALVYGFDAIALPLKQDAGTLTVRYSAFGPTTNTHNGTDGGNNLLGIDPMLRSFTPNGLCDDDLRPIWGSPLVDAGDPAPGDEPDGTTPDIGDLSGVLSALESFEDGDSDDTVAKYDCDDADPNRSPDAIELCNGIDDDCDELVDDGLFAITWYFDGDDDDFGTPDSRQPACSAPDDYEPASGDCDDSKLEVFPGADEVCGNEVDEDCDGFAPSCEGTDDDGDGYCEAETCTDGTTPGDCDDLVSDVNPAAIEVCNDVDDDCDGEVDDAFSADADADGYTGPAACEGSQDDCDDAIAWVNVGAVEICNGIDDDCDATIDEDLRVDADEDTYLFADGCREVAEPDCDDTKADVYPGAPELQDGVDNNCNDFVDEADPLQVDDDGDGACEAATCVDGSLPLDCDDTDPAVSSQAIEVLDGADNNCDEFVDNVLDSDVDNDGWSPISDDCNDWDAAITPESAEGCDGFDSNCDTYMGLEELDADGDGVRPCDVPMDCDDSDPTVSPRLAEQCGDGVDNNCNNVVDDDDDNDGDGFTTCEGDCDDDRTDVHPAAGELCNDRDDDCDGLTDEGFDLDADDVRSCEACPGDDRCDCDDVNALVHPGLPELCMDGLDNDCDGEVDKAVDDDADGFSPCDGDCDDADPFVGPRAVERCDGEDNDCDQEVDEGYDRDGDGVLRCRGDCDEEDGSVALGLDELCDRLDNDCDGTVDDGFEDADGDTWPECPDGSGDCNDGDEGVHPEAAEDCEDSTDNDCDGAVDDVDTDCVADDTDAPSEASRLGYRPWFCGVLSAGHTSWLWLVALGALGRRRYTGTC